MDDLAHDGLDGYILGVDPGRAKCGLALLNNEGKCITRLVVSRTDFESRVTELIQRYAVHKVILGDRTGSAEAMRRIKETLSERSMTEGAEVRLIPEHRSSEEGRRLYLLAHRKGWRRLVPVGLQWPPEPFDDYTAEVIARRYLSQAGHQSS